MIHGLLWFPLLLVFVLLTSLGWLERRRQNLYRIWAEGSELAKLDGCGAAKVKEGFISWSSFEAGSFQEKDTVSYTHLTLPTTPYV